MGKDNIPFHTVGFPVTIMGSGEPGKLVDQLKGFNYINYYGGKFSTSQQRGVFMDTALEILPADYWRYYLIANAPEGSDSNFTWDHFAGVVNKDLADVLGNFVNRITKFCVSRFDGRVPEGSLSDDFDFHTLIAPIWLYGDQITTFLEEMKFREAMKSLRALLVTANEYVTEAAPWTTYKSDHVASGRVINVSLNLCHLLARFCSPLIPNTSDKIFAILNSKGPTDWPIKGEYLRTDGGRSSLIDGWLNRGDEKFELVKPLLSVLPPGHELGKPEILFHKITDEQIAEWTARFGGPD
jgi:methionyl-tRNA synthetase